MLSEQAVKKAENFASIYTLQYNSIIDEREKVVLLSSRYTSNYTIDIGLFYFK